MYRPLNEKTRSPQYTIRLDALRFQPSAKQEALLQRIDRYVRGEKSREEVREGHKAAKKRRQSLTRDRRRDALAELLAAHRDALWAALEQDIPECAQLDATALRFRVRAGPRHFRRQPASRGTARCAGRTLTVSLPPGRLWTRGVLRLTRRWTRPRPWLGGFAGSPSGAARTLQLARRWTPWRQRWPLRSGPARACRAPCRAWSR